jgi:hypothetical protein
MLSLHLVSHMELSECVQYRPLEWLQVHLLVHFYSLISTIMRKVYPIRQIITPQERISSFHVGRNDNTQMIITEGNLEKGGPSQTGIITALKNNKT